MSNHHEWYKNEDPKVMWQDGMPAHDMWICSRCGFKTIGAPSHKNDKLVYWDDQNNTHKEIECDDYTTRGVMLS